MLTRPGFELLSDFLYETEPLFAVLANLNTNPIDTLEADLIAAEIDADNGNRIPLTLDNASYNTTTRTFDVVLSGSVTSTVTAVVNRLALYRGGTGLVGDTTGDLIGTYQPQAAISLISGNTTSVNISGSHVQS